MTETNVYQEAANAYESGNYELLLRLALAYISSDPKDDYAFYLAGVASKELSKYEEALSYLEKAVQLNSTASNARLLIASVLRNLGKLDEAIFIYESLIDEYPGNSTVASNYSFLLNDIKKFDKAIEILSPFVQDENIGEGVCINIGNAFRGIGDLDKANEFYEKALQKNGANWAGAMSNLAAIKMEQGCLDEAKKIFLELDAKKLAPKESYLNLGIICSRLNNTNEAIEWIIKGESMGLNSISAVSIYAYAQSKLGNVSSALNKIHEAYDRGNIDFMLLCVWLDIAQKYCVFDELRVIRPLVVKEIGNKNTLGVTEVNLFSLLACDGITASEHFELAKKAATRLIKNRVEYSHVRERKKILKIGYLSADFRDHPVAHLMIGVFKNHDRENFEIYGYNIGQFNDSIYRYRSIAYLDHYFDCAAMDYEQLAAKIKDDNIDILVDLVGYTENSKPQALYYKPAPIIISYLGFVGTTGMAPVDYIIADEVVLPETNLEFYTEKPIYLPRCYQATDGTLLIEHVTREDLGLPKDKFVFVTLNNSYKLNENFIKTCTQILKSCVDSIIWMLAESTVVKENLQAEFMRNGIAKDRIYFFERQTKGRFLGALGCADLFLDSYPYNAGTTASDAIYSGCPVITIPKEIYASRMAASILTYSGLGELVCVDNDAYINLAIKIYENKEYRNHIKNITRQAKFSRLFDTVDAVRCLENAYLLTYENFCEGNLPKKMTVKDYEWSKTDGSEVPNVSLKLSAVEVESIKKKLKLIDGDDAIKHFETLIEPNKNIDNKFQTGNSQTTKVEKKWKMKRF